MSGAGAGVDPPPAARGGAPAAVAASRESWLHGLCLARVLLYANFMVYAACLPVVQVAWGMSAAQAGSISSGFMLGYALSLGVFSWLADRLGARRVVLLSAVISAGTAVLFGLVARSYVSALLLYTLAGLAQGGNYTPFIMLMAERYEPRHRGAAVGWLIGSTSVGYALSLAVSGAMLGLGDWRLAFIVTGLLPIAGAALTWAVLRGTPNRVHERGIRLGFATVFRTNPNARRLVAGYVAHSWELLGMWAWMPAFLAANAMLAGGAIGGAAAAGAYLSALLHATGALAASSMGTLSDRLGRRAVLVGVAATSACLSLSLGWLVAWPVWLMLPVALLYGASAIGDSPVLSVALTEVVEPGYLGSMLALRSLLGFGAGAVAPLAFGMVLDLSNPAGVLPTTWGFGFGMLGLGGLLAVACALLVRLPSGRGPAGS